MIFHSKLDFLVRRCSNTLRASALIPFSIASFSRKIDHFFDIFFFTARNGQSDFFFCHPIMLWYLIGPRDMVRVLFWTTQYGRCTYLLPPDMAGAFRNTRYAGVLFWTTRYAGVLFRITRYDRGTRLTNKKVSSVVEVTVRFIILC